MIRERAMLLGFLHDGFVRILPSYSRHEAVFFLDPDDLLVVHDGLFLPFQPHFYGPPAIFRFSFVKDLFHERVIIEVLIGCIGEFQPPVVSAPRDARDGAQELCIVFQRSDDRELLKWS